MNIKLNSIPITFLFEPSECLKHSRCLNINLSVLLLYPGAPCRSYLCLSHLLGATYVLNGVLTTVFHRENIYRKVYKKGRRESRQYIAKMKIEAGTLLCIVRRDTCYPASVKSYWEWEWRNCRKPKL